MRVTEAASYRTLLENVGMLNERLERANEEISSGKRLTHLHSGPSESAEMVQLENQLASLDQYQTNADNTGFFLQVSDSTLSSVNDLLTAAFTRGSAAANNFNDSGAMSALAGELTSIRDQLFSLANTQVRGRYIFAGAQVNQPAFTISGNTVTYQGDHEVNAIDIGNGLQVKQNIAGDTVFNPAFAAMTALLTAVEAGDQAGIKSALEQFAPTLATMNRARATLGVDLSKLQDWEFARQEQQTNIQTRQAAIGNADIAQALAEITQGQTALEAALGAGAIAHQKNLFDYLG